MRTSHLSTEKGRPNQLGLCLGSVSGRRYVPNYPSANALPMTPKDPRCVLQGFTRSSKRTFNDKGGGRLDVEGVIELTLGTSAAGGSRKAVGETFDAAHPMCIPIAYLTCVYLDRRCEDSPNGPSSIFGRPSSTSRQASQHWQPDMLDINMLGTGGSETGSTTWLFPEKAKM